MADFSTPFGSVGGNLRLPTIDEREEGFPCGPLDRQLFNELIRAPQAEIGAVVEYAAVTPSDSDDTTLLQSILALIDAATGGSGDFVLMAQARARLPIFPDVQTADGTLGVTTPATGQVRIPASKTFLHRGIFPITTVQTDFSTLSSKTYHLRWNPTDGFALKDLADVAYNPDVLAETNITFDSTYDNMLVARVTTNSSNVVTVRNLINQVRISNQTTHRVLLPGALDWVAKSDTSISLNWARTPVLSDIALNEWRSNNAGPDGNVTPTVKGNARAMGARLTAVTRYGISNFEYYYEDTQVGTASEDGLFSVIITALAV